MSHLPAVFVLLVFAQSINALIQHTATHSHSQGSHSTNEKEARRSSSSTHNQHCPAVPKIDITSYSRAGFKPSPEKDTELTYLDPKTTNVIIAPFVAHIVLKCVSTSPIEWVFDGPFHPSISSIQVFYDSPSTNDADSLSFNSTTSPDNSNSCFRITIALKTTKTSTGKYWCRTVDSKYSSSWYLYGEGNTPPTLLYHGQEFNIVPNGSHPVILPCQVVNPQLKPRLTKGAAGVIGIDNSVPYDPQVGFTLDLAKIPNPYDDKYQCSDEFEPITFNIQKPPGFSVTPTSETLVVAKKQTIMLICEGIRPVGLQGFIDDSRVTFLDYPEGSEFRYRVQYEYYGLESSSVSCIDLAKRNAHHTWNIRVIDKETDDKSGISYDATTKSFVCRSKTKHMPVMGIGQCSNALECLLMDKCFTWNVPYKLTRIRPNTANTCSDSKVRYGSGQPCARSGNEEYLESVGCVTVKNSGSSGVVHCGVTELNWTSTMYYFNGLKSGQDLVISNWRDAPLEELAYVEVGRIPGIGDNSVRVNEISSNLYVGESVQFTCSATKFLFSFGFKWMFQMQDGSYITPTEENTVNDPGMYVYRQMTNLVIENQNIKSVVCYVHFWNTSEWLNVSKELKILESIAPLILFPNGEPNEPLQFLSGSNESIICKARGTPSPSVNWYRDGKRIESQTTILEDDNTIQGSRLYFGHIDKDDEGEYTCVAENVRGNVTTGVKVSVTSNRQPIYTSIGVGIIVCIIFAVVVGVLWWKLKKNKEIIKKLTQKEYEQFRKGDRKAMLNAPDDGYIRAQYMPYDKDYEIPEENLDIDKESVLGTGEYGLVLKGTLRQNNMVEEVAVKTNRTNSDSNHLKALLCELKILTYIGWHANVINLRGAVTTHIRERDVYVVVEYCKLGNLENYLRVNKPYFLHQIVNDKIDLTLTFNPTTAVSQSYQPMQTEISTADLINWSHQISGAMEFLANKKVVHGDLAARNILLTGDRSVKITDFGLSKHLYNDCSNYVCHSSRPLPWKWLAPEILQHQKFSTQTDVWAFAITLWEMFSLGEAPYPGIAYSFDFKHKLLGGFRMDKPEYANNCIWAVIQQCWATSPPQRPSFAALRKYFSWLLHHWDDPKGPPNLINDEVRYINPNEINHILFDD